MSLLAKLFPFFKFANAQSKLGDNRKSEGRARKDEVIYITKSEYLEPTSSEYVRHLLQLTPEEIYDNYNPGPTKPDGSVNFECHCVSHMVASPCGYAFRKAITCQKAATEEELEKGACAEEFMEFMECVIKTQCFRRKEDGDNAKIEEEES